MAVGSAALIGGVGIFRITDRQQTADGVELSVEEAPLTNVIADGVIAFRRRARPSSTAPWGWTSRAAR